MAITHRYNIGLTSDGGGAVAVQGNYLERGTVETILNEVIPASTTDHLISVAFTVANLQSVALVADKNCTIETNSGSSPVNTINLKAGSPLIWSTSPGYFSNPFTGSSVTGFYVTTTDAVRLKGRILVS